MSKWRIVSEAAVEMGIFEGDTREDALDAFVGSPFTGIVIFGRGGVMSRPDIGVFRSHQRDAGQIVCYSYAATESQVWQRIYDSGDGEERYYRAPLSVAEELLGTGDWTAEELATVADRINWIPA